MKTKYWIVLLGALFVLFAVLTLLFFLPGRSGGYAEVWSEGHLVQTVDLRVPQSFTVESSHGSNTVTVSDGKIAVTAATCPDHYCMKRGQLDSGADIICLPNQLVIRFTGPQATDATAG